MLTCIFESVHEAKTSIEADQPDPKVTANSPRLIISSSFLRNWGGGRELASRRRGGTHWYPH